MDLCPGMAAEANGPLHIPISFISVAHRICCDCKVACMSYVALNNETSCMIDYNCQFLQQVIIYEIWAMHFPTRTESISGSRLLVRLIPFFCHFSHDMFVWAQTDVHCASKFLDNRLLHLLHLWAASCLKCCTCVVHHTGP